IEGTREQTRLKTGQELLAGELTAAQAELDELVQLQSVDTDNLKALQHEQQLLSQNSSQSQPSDRTPDVIKKLIDELLVKLKEDGALRQKADTEFATALKQLKALDDSMSQMSEIIATRRQANQEQISKLESSLKDRDQQIVKLKQKSLTLEKQIADAKSENQNGLAVAKYALTGGWEWRRLSYLADLPIKLFPKNDAPGARIPALHGLARSPQGDWIVTGTDEGDILTVSTTDGSTQVKNKVHGSPIAALAVSADGKLIASAGTKDRTIRLSHPASPQLVAEINVPTDVLSLDFSPAAMSPQRTWLLAACSDQMLRLWDLADATQPQSLPALRKEHDLKLTQAIFSPDGRQLVSVGEDRAVVWDLAAKAGAAPYERRQAVFGWHSGSTILAVDYTLQGTTRRIVTADNNGRIVVWNPDQLMSRADADKDLPRRVKENSPAERNQASARELQHHETNDSAPINFVTFSHDGRFVLSGSDDHTLQFQSVDAGSRGLPTTFRGHGRAVRGGTIVSREAPRPTEKASMGKLGETDPNHWFIVSVGEDGHAYRWNIGEYRENVRIETDPLPVEGDGPDRAILSTAFNSQGTSIIAGGADRIARIWDLRGQLEQEFSEKSSASLEQGHQLPIWTAAFSPRGDWFITAGMDGRSLIWDSHSQTQWAARLNGTGVPSLLAVSPDGRWIATATSQRAGQLAVWSVEKLRRSDNAEPVMFLGPHAKHATGLQLAALTFAPDIFDAATGKVRLYAAFFSNQESDSTGEQDLVWDLSVKDGSLEAHPLALPHLPGRYVTAAAFLAGGQELLTAATDGRILRIPVDQPGKSPTVSVEKGSVDFLHVLPDQKLLMVCRPTPKSIVLRKTRPDGTLESPSDELLLENVKEVLSASVSPAGDEAVLVCSAGLNSARKTSKSTLSEVRRFDVRNLKEVRPNNRPFLKQGQGEQARYWGAIFSTRKKAGPGNEILALHGTRAELVDAEGNTSARAEPQGPITAVSFSKSGKLALTAAVATIRIWDRETGADLKHITEPVSLSKVTRAVFSPTTEKWVLSAGYDGEKNYVRLWDVEKEGDQPAKTFSHKSRVHHIAFSADGEKFVSACEDGTVWIWDLNNDQQELTHWAAHDDGAALCAEFS
ncbi:MAG: hypothetical protein JSS02_15130, partial [Planctomycetes bacterium]|nr:hypothetical protein [Planctomycetota bacterium]